MGKCSMNIIEMVFRVGIIKHIHPALMHYQSCNRGKLGKLTPYCGH